MKWHDVDIKSLNRVFYSQFYFNRILVYNSTILKLKEFYYFCFKNDSRLFDEIGMVSYILLVKSLRSVTLTNNSDRKSSFKPSRKKTVDFFLSGYTFKMLKPEQFIIALFHRFQISDQRLTKGIQSLSQTKMVEFLYLIWCKPVIFQTQTNN